MVSAVNFGYEQPFHPNETGGEPIPLAQPRETSTSTWFTLVSVAIRHRQVFGIASTRRLYSQYLAAPGQVVTLRMLREEHWPLVIEMLTQDLKSLHDEQVDDYCGLPLCWSSLN